MPNSKDIITNISKTAHINEQRAKECLDAILQYITDSLAQNTSVTVNGFGTFSTKIKKSRIKKDETTETIEQNTVEFKVGDTLAKRINNNANL